MFRVGVEPQRLGLTYECTPFFSLSIARVDPLPHQLEAVYLRRTREALVTFPDPETGDVHRLFTKREVRRAAFEVDVEELIF